MSIPQNCILKHRGQLMVTYFMECWQVIFKDKELWISYHLIVVECWNEFNNPRQEAASDGEEYVFFFYLVISGHPSFVSNISKQWRGERKPKLEFVVTFKKSIRGTELELLLGHWGSKAHIAMFMAWRFFDCSFEASGAQKAASHGVNVVSSVIARLCLWHERFAIHHKTAHP